MTVSCKFKYEQLVRHRLAEYEGYITGVVIRATHIEYEVTQITDSNGPWRTPIWIDEALLEAVKIKG